MEAGTRVPHTTIGSIKKSLLKRSKTENSSDSAGVSSSSSNATSSNAQGSASSSTSPTRPRAVASPQANAAATSSPPKSTGEPSSPPNTAKIGTNTPSSPNTATPGGGSATSSSASGATVPSSSSTANLYGNPPLSSSPAIGSPSSALYGPGVPRATTQIISNEPRVTLLVPSVYATWTPKLAWPPTPERPAWCYELSPNLSPELTAWLSPLLSAATRFNMGWAFMMDWVRRIGNPVYANSTILDNIKQGMSKLTPCWVEFDKSLRIAEAWDGAHNAVGKLRNQIVELRGLVDAKVAGWYVQLNEKNAEESMEFTYKRQETRTPERPAWFFTPSDGSAVTNVSEGFKILERAANSFNDHWQNAFEAGKTISATNRAAAPAVRETILKALTALEPTWKEFEAAIAAFDAWNSVSLYTLEVKQHISSLRRLFESQKREWLACLDTRTSFVPTNKTDYAFEHDRVPTADRPAWVFKFNLQTPSEISRGLLVLSTAANTFNSNWVVAFDWANKIGKNLATRSAIREGMLGAFRDLEACWPHFESAISMLEPWESAATDVIRQVSQLRGLVEESREAWLARLATSQEIRQPTLIPTTAPSVVPNQPSSSINIATTSTNTPISNNTSSTYGNDTAPTSAIPGFQDLDQYRLSEPTLSPGLDEHGHLRIPSFSSQHSPSSSGVASMSGSFSGPSGGANVGVYSLNSSLAASPGSSTVGVNLDHSIGGRTGGGIVSGPNAQNFGSSATDARSIYENALAASREAASIADMPDTKLAFVPGLGPGSFRNADIYHAVLKELYRAQQIPDIPADLLEKVRTQITSTQERHRSLCFKWALFYAREGNMPRSLEYYEALHEVLPDACVELDRELGLLKAEFSTDSRAVSLASL